MNNDNTLMIEALIQSRSLKKVLREGDEFEDDFFSPDINRWSKGDRLYTVVFFPKPGNPKGIITHDKGQRFRNPTPPQDNKAKFWKLASDKNFLYNPYFGQLTSGPNSDYGPLRGPNIWVFYWDWLLCNNPPAPREFGERWAEGFIEGEDFIFVKFVKKEE